MKINVKFNAATNLVQSISFEHEAGDPVEELTEEQLASATFRIGDALEMELGGDDTKSVDDDGVITW